MLAYEEELNRPIQEHITKICVPIFEKAIIEKIQKENKSLLNWINPL